MFVSALLTRGGHECAYNLRSWLGLTLLRFFEDIDAFLTRLLGEPFNLFFCRFWF